MLQQTTVATVTPRWLAFMARFPDVVALAAATEEEVLDAWSGLGYYRRARQLHAAARLIATRDAGALPHAAAGWRDLPGIGPYTAGAIASIGLGEAVPAVDTNVVRVLTRLLCASTDEASALRKPDLERAAAQLVDPARPGDWNQALMDLGARLCTPTTPSCDDCPLARRCRARDAGVVDEVPPRRPRERPVSTSWSLLVMELDGGRLVGPTAPADLGPTSASEVRDGYGRLYRGYVLLPFSPWLDAPGDDEGLARRWTDWWGGAGGRWDVVPTPAGIFRHAVTRFRLRAHVISGRAVGAIPSDLAAAGYVLAEPRQDTRLAPPARRALAQAIDAE